MRRSNFEEFTYRRAYIHVARESFQYSIDIWTKRSPLRLLWTNYLCIEILTKTGFSQASHSYYKPTQVLSTALVTKVETKKGSSFSKKG